LIKLNFHSKFSHPLDRLPSGGYDDLDLSPAAFEHMVGPLSINRANALNENIFKIFQEFVLQLKLDHKSIIQWSIKSNIYLMALIKKKT